MHKTNFVNVIKSLNAMYFSEKEYNEKLKFKVFTYIEFYVPHISSTPNFRSNTVMAFVIVTVVYGIRILEYVTVIDHLLRLSL